MEFGWCRFLLLTFDGSSVYGIDDLCTSKENAADYN